MSEPFTNPPSMPSAPYTGPAPIPQVRELFALYMTCVTAGLMVLICVADLAVLLLHAPALGLIGLLSVVAPLGAVSIAAFTSLVNVYVVRRMPRGDYLKYDGSSGYDGYTAGSGGPLGALRSLLQLLTGQRTTRRLPVVSLVLLLVCLPLAVGPFLPPTTPLIGLLADWQAPPGDAELPGGAPVSTAVVVSAIATTPTALPTIPGSGTATEPPINTAPPTATTRPGGRPTATATRAVATATPTAGPMITFTLSPTSAPPYTNCTTDPAVPSQPLTLDNSQSTVAVSWQAAVDRLPSGRPWATITDGHGNTVTQGTVAAGRTQTITVNPDSTLCQFSQPPGKSWHVNFVTTPNAGPSPLTFTYFVS